MAGSKKEYSLGFMIGAQLKSSFPAAFKGAEKHLAASQKAVNNCKAAWADFGTKAGKMVLGVTGAAAGIAAAVWKMTDSVAEAGNRVDQYSAKLHMNAESFQELEYAFGKAGLSGEQFTDVVKTMNETLAKASKDSKAAQSLAAYGLSAEKLAKMEPEQAIMRMSDYFAQMEDPAERARLSMELFGGSAAVMEAAMMQGAESIQQLRQEARSTGVVMSETAAKQAAAYSAAKDRLTKSVEGIKRQLFGPMMGAFSEAFSKASDKMAQHMPQIQEFGSKLAAGVVDAIPKVLAAGQKVVSFIQNLWDKVIAFKNFMGGWKNVAILGTVIAALPTIISGVQAIISTFKVLKTGFALVTKLLPMLGGGGLAALGPLLPIIAAVAAAAFIIYKNWDKLKPLFDRILGSLKAAWDKVWPKIQEAIARMMPTISKIGDVVAALLAFIMPMLERGIDFIATVIVNAIDLIGPLFDIIGAVVTFFVDLVSGNWSALSDDFRAIVDAIQSFWSAALTAAANIAQKWVEGILNFFKPLTDFFKGIGDKIASIFGGKKTLQVETVMAGETTANAIAAHATGGIFTRPHVAQIAEAGDAEAVVPINSKPRSRAIWETAGRLAGFFQGGGRQPSGQVAGLDQDDDQQPLPIRSMLQSGGFRAAGERAAELAQRGAAGGGHGDISVPVTVSVAGNATQETVSQLKNAAGDIANMVRAQVEAVLAERKRRDARLEY